MSVTEAVRGEGERGARLQIALCFAVAILEGFDIQVIGVAAPKIARELGLSPDALGYVFLCSNIGMVIGAAFGGWLADLWGRKPVFVASVAMFGVFTLSTALATDFTSLALTRVLTGLGFGAALPNMMAVSADVSRGRSTSLVSAAIFCGLPAGAAFSAVLTQVAVDWDWRVLFYIGGGAPLILAPMVALLMRETLKRGADAPARRINVLSALFGEGRAARTLLLWCVFFPAVLTLYLMLYWLPSLFIAKGFDPAMAPRATIAFNCSGIVGALLLGALVDRWGVRWLLSATFLALVAVLAALALVSEAHLMLALAAASGFLLLGSDFALRGVAAGAYPAEIRGVASGGAMVAGRAGSLIGPLAPGLLLAAGHGPEQTILLMAPVILVASVAVFALGDIKRAL